MNGMLTKGLFALVGNFMARRGGNWKRREWELGHKAVGTEREGDGNWREGDGNWREGMGTGGKGMGTGT